MFPAQSAKNTCRVFLYSNAVKIYGQFSLLSKFEVNRTALNSNACRGSCYISGTHLLWASVKCTTAAILEVVVTCHSGVTGALVMEP